jgi:glycosyltransferase involved in cell wall biosynthesis
VLDSTFVLPVWDHGGNILLHLHNLEHTMFARDDGVARSFTDRWTRWIEARAIRSSEERALAFSQVTVTVSDDDRRRALALRPNARVEVVPNSVDLERLPLLPPAPPGPPRLLFVGGLDYPPNLEAVTELVEQHLPALRAAFPGLRVRLVGRDGGHDARFRGADGVEVIGRADDLLPHYRDSHAVYLPIRSGGGTRIKILEAWALGRPVLATRVAAEGLGVQDGVQLRTFETVDAGVAALREVLAGQGAKLVAAGRAFVEQHHSHRAAIARLREIVAAMLTPRG